MDVKDIRNILIEKYNDKDFIIDKTGVKTIEIIGASFIANEPAIIREPNYDYIKRELVWYESQSLNIKDIPGNTPKIWEQVADKNGFINSNYGYLVFSDENYNQYDKVLEELRKNPNSRRANIIYTRPKIWIDYKSNNRSDFICTNNVMYLIRDNKLNAIVNMRSNDVCMGYNNDVAFQKYVLSKMTKDLNIEIGNIYWQVGSLHVYESQFWCLDFYNKFNRIPKDKHEYDELIAK